MNIYRISQHKVRGYDTYDSAVVIAESSFAAGNMHPGNYVWRNGTWRCAEGVCAMCQYGSCYTGNTWCTPKYVIVELLGTAQKGLKPGVVCASFNAG